ncbi:MAG: GAF domain-containing protein [Mojavia pulchra JT2-VF2]|jgi:PAS domain S-box-containing protein|uniref:histidine kinase n=1 Tax=Mojavia pulchra JT2-VF2 TaxID=287848 RepID=A0A951Q3H4_9NOST|nr:GAF domain-containing protein [Mojavia pulchra JT2-VF2]
MHPVLSNSEAARLEALRQYQILDTEPEEAYDNLAKLAAFICGAPIALVNFIDENRQWFKARLGLDVPEMPRNCGLSYLCQERKDVVVISDTLAVEDLVTNPVVISYPFVRFYAGVPLIAPNGEMLGTLCVLDQVPRELNQQQVEALIALSRQVISQLELRRNLVEVSRFAEELKRTEKRLTDSENLLRTIIDSEPECVKLLAKDGTLLEMNPAGLAMIEADSLNQVRGQCIHPIIAAEYRQAFIDLSERVFQGESGILEFEIIGLKGTPRWMETHAVPLRDSKQNIIALLGVTRDITENKYIEASLRESEKHLNLALQAAKLGSWQIDWKTSELTLSNQCKVNFGLPVETEFTYNTLLECIHPDDRTYMQESVKQALANHSDYEAEYRNIWPDGSVHWILSRGVGIYEPDGNPTRMIGVTLDLTERKRAEEELKRQYLRSQLFSEITLKIRESLQLEEILQTTVTEVQKLLQADRVVIFRLWPDGSGTVVQEAVLPGWPVILGQNILDPCFQQGYVERYRQGRVSAITDVEKADIRDCHRKFLQQHCVKANLVVPILIREGIWGLLIAHQCTAPRQWHGSELELLQQLANQIGIALSQAQLLEQQTLQSQELTRSNAELEQFAYIASHDLQEPLRMVTSYLQLLERKYKNKLDANADEFIAYAVDGALRMQTLINDLLNYSRVSTRGEPFALVNCTTVLARAIANLRVAIEESRAVITHGFLPEVMADSIQLTQVFQNLIGNAIKFRREEPPQIHITAIRKTANPDGENSNLSPSENEWLFSVRDNGIGLETQYAERIFVIFQRLHSRSKYPGTGIGLAICKKIIERHGGRIWMESEPGQGSIFYFTIPDQAGKQS